MVAEISQHTWDEMYIQVLEIMEAPLILIASVAGMELASPPKNMGPENY